MRAKFAPIGLCLSAALLVTIQSLSGWADTREDWERMRKLTPLSYVASYVETPIQIDGKLNDAGWRDAPWSEKHSDIEGDVKPKPRFDTRFKIVWDDQHLYFGCKLQEPHVWGTLTQHDSVIFQDNDIELFIDPNGDNHEYFEFEMNALNTGWDLFLPKPYKDDGSADNDWEIPGLKTAVHVEGTLNDPTDVDSFWSVEIAIPWKAMQPQARKSTPPVEGDHWRMNFSRVEWEHEIVDGTYQKIKGKREDNWVWSPQGIVDMHRPERWGYVWFTKQKTQPLTQKPTDRTLPLRDALMAVYHAQKAQLQSGNVAYKSLSEMTLDGETRSLLHSHGFEMKVAENGVWEATVQSSVADLRITHDSKLTVVP